MTGHLDVVDHALMAISPTRPTDRSDNGDALTGGLVDELLAYYIDWREDAKAAARAYAMWSCAPTAEAALRFSTYLAALDQEETSATRYALVVKEVARALSA